MSNTRHLWLVTRRLSFPRRQESIVKICVIRDFFRFYNQYLTPHKRLIMCKVRNMAKKGKSIILLGQVENKILYIRGCKVILDADLATLYDVPTKRLNEQVKRNHERFPQDFMFQLTKDEKDEVVAN